MVFNLLLICIDFPFASLTFQHLQVRGCCHDIMILSDLGGGRMQLDGRVQEEGKVCVLRPGWGGVAD